jgi:hypothetical protein
LSIATSGNRNVVISALPGPPPITYPNQAYSFASGLSAAVAGASNVKAMAVEGSRTMAVTHDGRVVTSGFPENWLADGVVDSLTNIVAVGLNYTGGAALTADGRVIEVGRLSQQQPALTNAIAIDVSGQFNDDDLDYKLAVTRDGRVVVWGLYEFGYPPSAELPGVVTAAGGWSHIVALKSNGTVVEWDVDNPPAVVPGLSNIVAVAAGGEHSVALKADGTVVAWGQNFFGQTNVPADLSDVVAISASENLSVALKRDGTLAAWGQSYLGGSVTPPAGLSNVMAIATSATRNLALVGLPPGPLTLGIVVNASTAGKVTIILSGEPNKVYAIEASADLVTWQVVGTVTSQTGTSTYEMEMAGASRQFFRAK